MSSAEGPRIAFKAGRAFRREGTNWVDPNPTKGAIILQNGDDGLLHFMWKNRTTNEVEEDLILFPSDATFVKVPQSKEGRTYVLKFSSSNQRLFFWLQDADRRRDEEFVSNVNRLLADPDEVPVWWTGSSNEAGGSSSNAGASTSTAAQASSSSQPAAPAATGNTGFQFTPEQLRQFQSLVEAQTGSSGAEYALSDILTPANLNPLFTSHPELIQALFPHLPPDLPSPPTPETLRQIIASPQFQAAVRNLDQALRTGLLGGLVRGLGLPEEAGLSLEAFLRAIQEQARHEGGDSMDTD
ncbi:adhesion regulating molecule [Panus rudis PR-1116 ss-1]|nr:adhesion regulating molecule [Panus rudis PR-1116 ss-1]